MKLGLAGHLQFISHKERSHRVINAMLGKFCIEHMRDWDLYIPMLRFALDTAVNQGTGETPFYLNHGQDPRLPIAIALVPKKLDREKVDIAEFTEELHMRLQIAF